MTTTAQDIIDRVQRTLNDAGAVRWPEPEILDAINDAELALLEARPDLYEETTDFLLSPGNLQVCDATCYRFVDVLYNIDSDGNRGKAITFIKKATLDRQSRAWTTDDDEDTTVRHWTRDEREWKQFYVAPAQPSGTSQKVKIRQSVYPTPITAAGDQLSSPDELRNAIYYFCVTRAFEKDEKFSGSPQAARFQQLFAAFVAVDAEAADQGEKRTGRNEGR